MNNRPNRIIAKGDLALVSRCGLFRHGLSYSPIVLLLSQFVMINYLRYQQDTYRKNNRPNRIIAEGDLALVNQFGLFRHGLNYSPIVLLLSQFVMINYLRYH